MNDTPEMPTPDTPQVLLEHKVLRLPTILSEYDKVARQCATEQADYPRYLLRLTELELLDRDRRAVERRIRQAKFPVVKSLDSFEFLAIPSLNKTLVLELARCEFLSRKENLLLLGNSGTGKTHIALALGLSACQRGHRVRFTTAAALVSELIEARDDKHLLRFQKQLASYELLIVDELGYVPLSKSGAELLFETFSQRYERASTLVTSNLPFEEWTEVFGSERLTGALLDRITHHVHILEMNGDSYRLKQKPRQKKPTQQPLTPRTRWGERARPLRSRALSPEKQLHPYPYYCYWSPFAPPQWSPFTPPLTAPFLSLPRSLIRRSKVTELVSRH